MLSGARGKLPKEDGGKLDFKFLLGSRGWRKDLVEDPVEDGDHGVLRNWSEVLGVPL